MNKSTKLLIVLLVVLVAIVYFFLPSEKERETSYKTPIVSVKIDSAAIVKIEIKQPLRFVVLENIGGTWNLTNPVHAPADPVAVAQILNSLSKFNVGSLISSNPDKQKLFQVDSTGTLLSLTDRSGKVFSMIVGKVGPSFSEIYFRFPDSKDVYLGEGMDSWVVNKNLKDWRNRYISHTPSEEMKEISITTPTKTFDFKHEGGEWKSGDKTLGTTEINPLLNTLSNLRADDFLDSAIDLKSKPILVNIKAGGTTSLSLYPFPSDTARYIVRSSSSEQLFIVNKWSVQQILSPIGKPAPAVHVNNQPIVETKKPQPATTVKKEVTSKPKQPVQSVAKEKETKQVQPITPPVSELPKFAPKKKPTPEKPSEEKPPVETPPLKKPEEKKVVEQTPLAGDDEGSLIVHTVAKGETMTSIAKKYNVRTEQILKWNLLKSISVKPGQELYIYVKK